VAGYNILVSTREPLPGNSADGSYTLRAGSSPMEPFDASGL
jgi:hypothetical protein